MKAKSFLSERLDVYAVQLSYFTSSLAAGCVFAQLIEHRVQNYLHITWHKHFSHLSVRNGR